MEPLTNHIADQENQEAHPKGSNPEENRNPIILSGEQTESQSSEERGKTRSAQPRGQLIWAASVADCEGFEGAVDSG